MDFKKFSRLVNNPRNISGIYNYCDRWCERCPFTLRCATYSVSMPGEEKRPPHDKANEALWERLRQCEPLAADLLKKHADHAGVGLADHPKFKNILKDLEAHRTGNAASRYMEFAHKFVEDNSARFAKEAPESLALPPGPDDSGPPVSADEAFEIITWYHLFISVKLARALHRDELDDELDNDPELRGMPKDSDGSAKIALIATDHSIVAWAVLGERIPEFRQTSLHAMLTLDRLRRAVEKDVPNARSFVRPGFDTVTFPKKGKAS